MRRYLDLSSWILLFALLPFSVLAFLSQGAVPGDLFYPVKRGLENVILVASSVHPATKVAFRTDLTERRFKEAEQLLVLQGQTTGLSDFVGHVQTVEEEILKLSSLDDKRQASDKLIAKIEEYETKLAAVQVQVEQQPVSQPDEVTPAPQPQQPTSTSVSQTPTPTPQVQTPPPTQKPIIQIPFQPQQTSTPAPILDTAKKEEVVTKVEETKEKLKEIKERVRKEREDAEVQEKIREEAKKQLERQRENRGNEGRGRNENDD